MTRDPDVLVVGGGPAGLAVAIRAREADLSVIVLDRGVPAHDKACGEGLMPRAVRELASLGVSVAPEACRAFRGIRFVQQGSAVAEARFSGSCGIGMRRPLLHAALVGRAEDLGARILWGVRVVGLAHDGRGVVTDSGTLRARFVVGADGLHSRVRIWAGLDAGFGMPRYGVRRHFAAAPWSDCVEVHWADGVEGFVTPVSPGLVGVNLTWDGSPSRFDDLLARLPSLRDRLAGALIATRDRGAGPLRRRVVAVHRGRVALVGDAAGYLDSIAGEGLGLAFLQAGALVRAMLKDDLAAYAAAHRRIGRMPSIVTHALLLLARRPGLRRGVVRILARQPRLFSALLDAGCGGRIADPTAGTARQGTASRPLTEAHRR